MSVKVYDKILSQKGINHLLDFLHKKDRYYQEGQFVRKQGFIFGANDWPEKLLLTILRKVEVTTSPYAIMMIDLDHQLGIHTDTIMGSESDKNIIIPLEMAEQSQTVIFKNKWYGSNMNLTTDNKNKLDFLSDKPFSKKIHEKYLLNFDYNLLCGLEVEHIYEWKIGSVCVFDSHHLHTNATVSKYKKAIYIWTRH